MAFSNYDSPNTIWFSAREQVELFNIGDSLHLDVHPDCYSGFAFYRDDVVALRDALTCWLDNGGGFFRKPGGHCLTGRVGLLLQQQRIIVDN